MKGYETSKKERILSVAVSNVVGLCVPYSEESVACRALLCLNNSLQTKNGCELNF